jgi:hypothetical protein
MTTTGPGMKAPAAQSGTRVAFGWYGSKSRLAPIPMPALRHPAAPRRPRTPAHLVLTLLPGSRPPRSTPRPPPGTRPGQAPIPLRPRIHVDPGDKSGHLPRL